jgi:flagellar hook-associated protein 2
MGTINNPIFTGSSQFSQDFANTITNAVKLASLPITQLQNDVTTLQNQASALSNPSTGIGARFAALQSAVQGIDQAMRGSSFQTDISNTSAVSATASDGAMEGSYSIDVQNIGVYATSLSTNAWTDPSGPAHTYQLVISTASGSYTVNIKPSDNSAASVAQAINLAVGDKVQATVVNTGPGQSKISLKSNKLGPATLDILDGGTSLQSQGPTGQLATYSVLGSPPVSSDTRTIKLAPGLTVNLLDGDSGNPVNITVSRSTYALNSALSAFADAYNAAVDSVDAQRGQTQGVLGGQNVISSLGQVLSSLATFTSPGSNLSGLKALGLDLGTDGHFTYDQFSLMATDLSNSAGVTAFLGSATGGGFLKAATDAMTSVEDPTTGLIHTTETGYQNQIDSLNTRISAKQDQVNQLQENLQAQMAAADAAIASMEQQYSYLSSMFQAQQTADQMYK